MKLELIPYFLDSNTIVESCEQLVASRSIAVFESEKDKCCSVQEHLGELFGLKALNQKDISVIDSKRFLVDIPEYNYESSNERHKSSHVVLRRGNGRVYKVSNAKVIPNLAHVLVDGNLSIAERFAPRDIFDKSMSEWGSYFGYDINSHVFKIDLNHPHFKPFRDREEYFCISEYTPILVSNDINDRCFTHWVMQRLNDIYQLTDLIRHVEKPLFIFSYEPLRWQLESLSYFFPFTNVHYVVAKSPTTFEELIIPRGVKNQWFYGNFMSFMFSNGERNFLQLKTRKLYISRGDASGRRILNERELLGCLIPNGFESIDLGKLSFALQISLIKSASAIIFTSGSSGMNLLHALPRTRIGIISPGLTIEDSRDAWVEVCNNFGLPYVELITASRQIKNDPNSDLIIDLEQIKGFVNSSDNQV